MKLTAYLQQDRSEQGVLIVEKDGVLAYAFACLGKSDQARATEENNKERNPLKRFGDIPTGEWIARIVPSSGPGRSYGPHKRLLLKAVSGDALKAMSEEMDKDGIGGRYNILVHGGEAGSSKTSALLWLRPTLGCLRLANNDMGCLIQILESAGLQSVPLIITELIITPDPPPPGV